MAPVQSEQVELLGSKVGRGDALAFGVSDPLGESHVQLISLPEALEGSFGILNELGGARLIGLLDGHGRERHPYRFRRCLGEINEVADAGLLQAYCASVADAPDLAQVKSGSIGRQ